MPQRSIPGVWMRGGTSKGFLVRESDLPEAGPERDRVVLEIMGSPDPSQIDGLGGGMSSASKVAIVEPSGRPDAEVEFVFGQVSVRDALIDWNPNSGNLTSAVAAYAVDEGLVPAEGDSATFTIYNKNSRLLIRATVPLVDGAAAVQGDLAIAGVPHRGSAIVNEYVDPAGSFLDAGALPTGNPVDIIATSFGQVEVSVVDAANIVMFVRAADLGLRGTELPDAVNTDAGLLGRVEELRGQVAVKLGLAESAEEAHRTSAILPLPSLLSEAAGYTSTQGKQIAAGDIDFIARVFSMQRMHHAHPFSGLICTSVAAVTPGTIPWSLRSDRTAPRVRVGHPKGVSSADVSPAEDSSAAIVSVVRTARRIMKGEAFYRDHR